MTLAEIEKLFLISSEKEFNDMALTIFRFQYNNNLIYRDFVRALNVKFETIDQYDKIPFLPISFFKTHDIVSSARDHEAIVFTSSSTTSQEPSRHIVTDISLYETAFLKGFELAYGKPRDYVILALLPGYLERQGSSLIYMFNRLIKLSGRKESGFFLNDHSGLIETLEKLKKADQKVVLIGVTYALLDLADKNIKLNDNFIIMETGGMKGKREELLKSELHANLKIRLGVSHIHSEYGMTELLSQAYSKRDGIFECPPWMKVIIRDINDPLGNVRMNKTGGINVIDLANVNSCSFIATQDLGRLRSSHTFELMGRFDNSDIRGCNLMIQ